MTNVPELYVTFYDLFPEVLPRAMHDHVEGDHSRCAFCGQSWPCDISEWVKTLAEERRLARTPHRV